MAPGLSCFSPATNPREMTITVPPPALPQSESNSDEKSPTLSLSFDHEDSDSPDRQKLISDEEMMRLLSGPGTDVSPTASFARYQGTNIDDLPAHAEQLTLTEFLREAPDQFSASPQPNDETPPKRRRLMSRVKTMTALPKAPTEANLTNVMSTSQAPSSISDSVTPSNSRKRKNMSLSSPFGSFKRILSNKRSTVKLGFNRSSEPEFEPVVATNHEYKQSEDCISSRVAIINNNTAASQSSYCTRTYPGAPILPDLPPVPTLGSRHSSSNTDTNTNITHTFPIINLPPTRLALNNHIIQLQSQLADIRLENQVLRDQITIVRKDWIDASQSLDLSRHESWTREMETYKLKVEVERLRGEIEELKRRGGVESENEKEEIRMAE